MSEQPLLSWSEIAAARPEDEADRLVAACLAGDETAYVALYDLYGGMVLRLAFSLLQHQQDAEEVLQDSFEYAFRKLGQFNGRKSSFKTWIYRITVSRCRNKRRRKWLPTVSLQQMIGQEVKDTDAPAPDDSMLATERQRAVWAALGSLSPKLREVAILRYYHSLPYNDIGAILDIPAKTAESRMRLAHKALREKLAGTLE